MANNPELTDYLAFFEAEPEVLGPEVGWYYGTKFVSIRGAERIESAIAPDEGEFSFRWWQSDTLRVDLNLAGIVD